MATSPNPHGPGVGRALPPGESGYATFVALVSMLFFAFVALEATITVRSELVDVAATVSRARLSQAADAGIAMATHGIGIADRTERWAFDGHPYRRQFGDVDLLITLEDGFGKVPLNFIEEQGLERMFEQAGARGEQIVILRDSFLDWRDSDDDEAPFGAEAAYYRERGIAIANGSFGTVEELSQIRGMTPAIYARIAPHVTIFGGKYSFSTATASPFAIAVMMPGGANSPAYIERVRELAGQREAIRIADNVRMEGRPITIRVTARGPDGGIFRRTAVVELTGSAGPGYVIRDAG